MLELKMEGGSSCGFGHVVAPSEYWQLQKYYAKCIEGHGKAQSNKLKVSTGSGRLRTQGGSSANTQHKLIW